MSEDCDKDGATIAEALRGAAADLACFIWLASLATSAAQRFSLSTGRSSSNSEASTNSSDPALCDSSDDIPDDSAMLISVSPERRSEKTPR